MKPLYKGLMWTCIFFAGISGLYLLLKKAEVVGPSKVDAACEEQFQAQGVGSEPCHSSPLSCYCLLPDGRVRVPDL